MAKDLEKSLKELTTLLKRQEAQAAIATKLAETIKDREPSNKPDQTGKIAKVLRSGYRYMMDDENYKVVRTAQVKLFG